MAAQRKPDQAHVTGMPQPGWGVPLKVVVLIAVLSFDRLVRDAGGSRPASSQPPMLAAIGRPRSSMRMLATGRWLLKLPR